MTQLSNPSSLALSVVVVAPPAPEAPDLVADLLTVGVHVAERCVRTEMARAVLRCAPQVVVCWEPQPGEGFLEAVRLLAQVAPTPVLVFTSDPQVEAMNAALDAGVAGWEVNGYAAARLRPLLQLAMARWGRERALRQSHEELTRRFDERKLVDRAKGILMTARQVSEDEAFRLLRTASMQAKQRIGQVSQQVIDAAHYGEAVNRAGRLRMLSQRVVKLYALGAAGVCVAESKALLTESVAQIDEVFATLAKMLSRPTFGDLFDAAQAAWNELQERLSTRGAPAAGAQAGSPAALVNLAALSTLDEAAERLLEQADRLTTVLEGAGLAPSLHVINTSGRQRMLAQRLAKFALLSAAVPVGVPPFAPQVASCAEAFEQGLVYLREIPLSTPAIRSGLDAADAAWLRMLQGAHDAKSAPGQQAVASASEELLTLFDRLTGEYERSMQVLIG